jgi:uncharacterized protein (TIGR02646 family)
MKKIIKQSEPKSLVEHRLKTNADYDNYSKKDDLRKSLLKEQGFICCYCMNRISLDGMKIEHWKSQSKYTCLQLDYQNLLGACQGGEGARPQNQHCDTKKAENEITINPANKYKNCENLISYRPDGTIYSTDEAINHDLNETLNLNLVFLKRNRNDALFKILDELKKKFPDSTWTENTLQKAIGDLNNKSENGSYKGYCHYAISYLKSKRSKL